jgi:hypothetical protein
VDSNSVSGQNDHMVTMAVTEKPNPRLPVAVMRKVALDRAVRTVSRHWDNIPKSTAPPTQTRARSLQGHTVYRRPPKLLSKGNRSLSVRPALGVCLGGICICADEPLLNTSDKQRG